jgi:hypothetical protein
MRDEDANTTPAFFYLLMTKLGKCLMSCVLDREKLPSTIHVPQICTLIVTLQQFSEQ